MYYALSDSFTGHNPKEHTHGFANTKEVIAFDTKKARDEWVEDTRLLSACALSHADAVKLAQASDGNYPGTEMGDRFVIVYDKVDAHNLPKAHVIRKA